MLGNCVAAAAVPQAPLQGRQRCSGTDEAILWPDALSREQVAAAAESEIVTVYPHRWAVPLERLAPALRRRRAGDRRAGLQRALPRRERRAHPARWSVKARDGVRRTHPLRRPRPPEVAQHGDGHRPWEAMAARVRNALVLFEPLRVDNVEIRLHRTVLYNSIYRRRPTPRQHPDLRRPAQNAPVLHLRRVAGGDMVTRTWTASTGSGPPACP